MSHDDLRTLLLEQREAIFRAWSADVQLQVAAKKLTRGELRDHLPAFLDDLAVALAPGLPSEDTFRSSQHGRQRLRLGFDVAAVVRDYGLLGDAILGVAESAGYRPTPRETRTLLSELAEGAASAVTSYAERRDEELRDATERHIAFVAHELRTPLSSASLSLSMLDDEVAGTDFVAKRLSALQGSVRRLCHLVDNVLVAHRFDGHVELRAEDIDLSDLLEGVRADIAPHADARGVGLSFEVEIGLTFSADLRLIHSALENVVENAVKFTKQGGRVVVRGRKVGSRILFEVEDECGGLPPGKADDLFRPFVQRGTNRTGIGLGLAITKRAVEAHGGKIRVDDRPGSGCNFVIELPAGPS